MLAINPISCKLFFREEGLCENTASAQALFLIKQSSLIVAIKANDAAFYVLKGDKVAWLQPAPFCLHKTRLRTAKTKKKKKGRH